MRRTYVHYLLTAFVLCLLQGIPSAFAQTFTAVTGTANPFNGVDIGSIATPTFGKVDGDADFDCFIGESTGDINYYRNDGTVSAATFVARTGGSNPLDDETIGSSSDPVLVDIDGDGDLDLIIGQSNGNLTYYRNTGTTSSPNYNRQTGAYNTGTKAGNPMNGIDVGDSSSPEFVDIDGDGDLDCFIGNRDGQIRFYRNTGTATAPVYTSVTGTNNPFNNVDINGNSNNGYASPAFADLDKDGDLDCVIGEADGTLNYFLNTGTAAAPVFTQQSGGANPFNSFTAASNASPAFVDIDNDGDKDLFVGVSGGNILFFLNTSPLPVEFLSFEAERVSGQVLLTWVTATELNNFGFEVQRSMDAGLWQSLGFVPGAGTSQQVQQYAFEDASAPKVVSYYRLKQVDFDGAYAFSSVVEVTFASNEAFLSVYPNPSEDGKIEVIASGFDHKSTRVEVLDMAGRVVFARENAYQSANLAVYLDLAQLTAGVYTVRVADVTKQLNQRIFVK